MRNIFLLSVLLLVSSLVSLQAQLEGQPTLTEMLAELQQIALQREALILNLETASLEQTETLQQALTSLENSEAQLKEAVRLYTHFGSLVDERQIYLERLERGRNIWRIGTIVLGALSAGLIVGLVIK